MSADPLDATQSPPEIQAPVFVREIQPKEYKGREYYAARDAVNDRDPIGILRGLRRALAAANGRKVVTTITYE